MIADVLRHLGVSDDYPEQVLEVMGDAAGQLPDGLQALGLPQFGLQRAAIRLRADELGRALADPFVKARVEDRELLLGLPGHGPRTRTDDEIVVCRRCRQPHPLRHLTPYGIAKSP